MRYFLEDGDPDDGWVPGMDHRGGSRASQYHPRLGKIILDRLSQGETIKEVCADDEMPSMATLHRWRHMHPEFWAAYERMRDRQAAYRRMMTRLTRERWLEWARIEAKIGRRRTRTWAAGAKSTYDPARAAAFCARVAKGEAVYRICAEPAMPSSKAVYGWLKRQPEFLAMYIQAKRDAVTRLGFQVERIADQALDGAMTAARFRALKRQAARVEGRIGRLKARTYR